MRHRFILAALGLAGLAWAGCRDAADPGLPDPGVGSAADSTNLPPNAGFSFNCSGLTCAFQDTSNDTDGVIVRYDWTFGDGGSDTVPNPTHTYAAPGSYDVFHAVVDDDGAVDSLHRTVTVTADTGGGGNTPPIAFFTFNCSGLTCQFTDLSVDSGGAVVQWMWFFGDGGTDSTQNPTHTYAAPGSYPVTLFVRDNEGASDSTTSLVTVSDTTGGAVLTLVAEGFRVKGAHNARLLWSGATADSFFVFRDSVLIAGLSGDTTYVDNIGAKGHATYVYQVCQVGGGNGCSNTATVAFSRPSSTRR